MDKNSYEYQKYTEIKNYLDNKVWVTKKIRMNAAERCEHYDRFSKTVLTILSIICTSISALLLSDTLSNTSCYNWINLLMTFLSIVLMGLSILVSNDSLQVMADDYKKSYHALESLSVDFENLLDDIQIDETISPLKIKNRFNDLKSQYNVILNKYKNHTNKDYMKFIKSRSKQ